MTPRSMKPDRRLGGLTSEDAPSPVVDASWYTVADVEDGLEYRFAPGALAGSRFLHADMLLDGNRLVVFALRLREGESAPHSSCASGC